MNWEDIPSIPYWPRTSSRAVASGDYCQEGERGGGREIAGMARVTSWEEPALPRGWLQ